MLDFSMAVMRLEDVSFFFFFFFFFFQVNNGDNNEKITILNACRRKHVVTVLGEMGEKFRQRSSSPRPLIPKVATFVCQRHQ